MSSSSKPAAPPKKRAPDMNTVSCERAARGVWLVKVPKYLSEIWQKNEGNAIGSLITSKETKDVFFKSNPVLKTDDKPAAKVIVQPTSSKFAPPEDLKPIVKKANAAPEIPNKHRFIIKDLNNQTMAILAEDKSHLEEDADSKSGKLSIEGRVVKRAECQPPVTVDYMKMKITQIKQVSQPKNTVKQMDRAVVKFKPTAQHHENLAKEKAKKDNYRAVRLDRDVVVREIFQAFEKHQYYRLADLQRLTNQPASHIKDILTDIAIYNTVQPHKNMWELKPEYRSYNINEATANNGDDSEDNSD